MADPILKLALSQRFPQILKKAKIEKIIEKNNWSLRDSNLGLQIQSQLCLPLDQGFMKIAWKYEKILDGIFRIQILNIFS